MTLGGRSIGSLLAAVLLGVSGALLGRDIYGGLIADGCGISVLGVVIGSPFECRFAADDAFTLAWFITPVIALPLAGGLVVPARGVMRAAPIVCLVLAVGWFQAIAGIRSLDQLATPDFLAYTTLVAAPFLIAPPRGTGATRWTFRGWVVVLLALAILWPLDEFGSGFMSPRTDPQLAFAVAALAVLVAGLLGSWLIRTEVRTGETG